VEKRKGSEGRIKGGRYDDGKVDGIIYNCSDNCVIND